MLPAFWVYAGRRVCPWASYWDMPWLSSFACRVWSLLPFGGGRPPRRPARWAVPGRRPSAPRSTGLWPYSRPWRRCGPAPPSCRCAAQCPGTCPGHFQSLPTISRHPKQDKVLFFGKRGRAFCQQKKFVLALHAHPRSKTRKTLPLFGFLVNYFFAVPTFEAPNETTTTLQPASENKLMFCSTLATWSRHGSQAKCRSRTRWTNFTPSPPLLLPPLVTNSCNPTASFLNKLKLEFISFDISFPVKKASNKI